MTNGNFLALGEIGPHTLNQHRVEQQIQSDFFTGKEFLTHIHDRDKAYADVLPHNHSNFPGDMVVVEAYYMNLMDPEDTGYWKVTIGDAKPYVLRSMPSPTRLGVRYDLLTGRDSGDNDRYADLETSEKVASLIGSIGEKFNAAVDAGVEALRPRQWQPQHRRLGEGVLGRFLTGGRNST